MREGDNQDSFAKVEEGVVLTNRRGKAAWMLFVGEVCCFAIIFRCGLWRTEKGRADGVVRREEGEVDGTAKRRRRKETKSVEKEKRQRKEKR